MTPQPQRPQPDPRSSDEPSAPERPAPHEGDGRARRDELGYFLTFVGPLMTIGGVLAIWRTGDSSVFFKLLLPAGLVLWGLGFWRVHRASRVRAGKSPGSQQQ